MAKAKTARLDVVAAGPRFVPTKPTKRAKIGPNRPRPKTYRGQGRAR